MNLATLRTDARYLISPQLTAVDYPDVDLDRNLNRWYRTILGWIIPIQGDWEIQGDVISIDFPSTTPDILFPSSILRVQKGEVMYKAGGSFVALRFLSTSQEQSLIEGNATRTIDDVSRPTAQLFGDYISIRPSPDVTVVNGIKIWVQTNLVDLSESNPNSRLMDPVVRALSMGAAADYALSQEMYTKARELTKRIYGDAGMPGDKGIKGIIEELYPTRMGVRRDRLSARRSNFK